MGLWKTAHFPHHSLPFLSAFPRLFLFLGSNIGNMTRSAEYPDKEVLLWRCTFRLERYSSLVIRRKVVLESHVCQAILYLSVYFAVHSILPQLFNIGKINDGRHLFNAEKLKYAANTRKERQ